MEHENQRYRILERIDSGGMAEVYRGVAESAFGGLKKSVAIKRILPTLSKNKKFVSMFIDEARVSMHLQHANIASVFDIGVADKTYFLVLEYVDGPTLKAIVDTIKKQNRRLPVAQCLYIMIEVCKGLGYAHDATDPESGKPLGIVHRDVSPPNILVSKRGEIKLVDFGLAKASSQLEHTDPGVVKGKFSYLSPEAAAGEAVDHRADIFAVGSLLYELLTGQRLFQGENDYKTVQLVKAAEVPPIAPQNPDVSPELETIVRRVLARDRAQRFQTAGELEDALAHHLFARRLKVSSRDIESLVRKTLAERGPPELDQKPSENLIDTLINEEILKFTSLEDMSAPFSPPPQTPSPVSAPADTASLIDPRDWAEESSADGKTRVLAGADATKKTPYPADMQPSSARTLLLPLLVLLVVTCVGAALLFLRVGH